MNDHFVFYDDLAVIGFKQPMKTTQQGLIPETQTGKAELCLETARYINADMYIQAEKLCKTTSVRLTPNIRLRTYYKYCKTIVQKSSIHGFGLFANKIINQGEEIIEYQGLKIDSLMSDLVESQYVKNEFDSTYFFRMGNTPHVLDATFVGNGARFANHSCDPNAKSELKGSKIFLVALTDIKIGEEIVYNYNMRRIPGMPRVQCYCCSYNCNGFMDNTL